ncbi:MAG TPA: branched-chain amino acid transaminase [Longimicrobiaceae bacterium]|nr:branched-chain amino acid transaminase [Longimicrobiaceae bacterium]
MSNRINETEWIWRDGEFIRWWDATVHILCHSLQFGSSVFEGIRCYATPEGPAIFRLEEHLRRLVDSCKVYRMELPHGIAELTEGCRELVRRNRVEACYLRPMVVRGYGAAGMNPIGSPVETYLVCWPWGTYLGEGALEQGVDVCVSSWQRQEPNTYPAHAKIAGNYLNGQLARMHALADGYADAIALGPGGMVSEGSGQNLFLVRGGTLITPNLDGTNLPGITRDSILTLARDLGIPTREQPVPRETLYTADELFFTGTAAELTPIRSVDRIPVGSGGIGPVTRELQRRFLDLVHGRSPDPYGWLTPVNDRAEAVA